MSDRSFSTRLIFSNCFIYGSKNWNLHTRKNKKIIYGSFVHHKNVMWNENNGQLLSKISYSNNNKIELITFILVILLLVSKNKILLCVQILILSFDWITNNWTLFPKIHRIYKIRLCWLSSGCRATAWILVPVIN